MTDLVIDASVAIKWVVDEDDSAEAAALGEKELAAPGLLLVECANALWAKARRGELTAEEALDRLRALSFAPLEWIGQRELLEPAARLALDLGHPVYDCLYLALAMERHAPVVTADRRFYGVVRRDGKYRDYVRLLGE